MTNLLPPNSWAERKSKELREALPTLANAEENQFIYIGCCTDFTADTMDELEEANDEKWPGDGDAVELMREWCAGFDQWCETMGYVLDPSEGLTITNDQTLSYGKSYFNGVPCYWVDHSRIEYIWVDREYFKLMDEFVKAVGLMTGRFSCSKPNIANKPRSDAMHTHDDLPTEASTPAEKAKLRAAAKRPPNFSSIAAGAPFGHYARQEAASIAMGFTPGDHQVDFVAANAVSDEELSKVMADPMGLLASKESCTICKDGTTECNHLRQERKVQSFNQGMVAKGMTIQDVAHSSQEMREHAIQSGKPVIGTAQQARQGQLHSPVIQGSAFDFVTPELEEALRLCKERGVTFDTEKMQEILDANPPGDGPGLKEIAKTSATPREMIKEFRKALPYPIPSLNNAEAKEMVEKFRKAHPDLTEMVEETLQMAKERGVTINAATIELLRDEANAVSNHELEKRFGDDPHAMMIVPLAISMTDMDKWGCPYCGYCQGSIPAVAEGTILWVCIDCHRGCHTLVDGLEMSAIAHLADIYPQLSSHPLQGIPKHSERRVTKSHEHQDSSSKDTRPEGGGDSAEGQ